MDNELLMLCHKYSPKKLGLCGNYISEKLDGQRLFWDGGCTIGMPISQVPWANKYDARKQTFISNGLWSRLGNKVHAPAWWVDALPRGNMLDGELWMGYEHRQSLMSRIKAEDGSRDWTGVRYMIYDSPPVDRFLSARVVNYSGRKHTIMGAMPFARNMASARGGFAQRYEWLMKHIVDNAVIKLHEQWIIPNGAAATFVDLKLSSVLAAGGEGLVLKGASSPYECARSHGCVKMKPFEDAEGVIVGWMAGEGRLLGMMGSLCVRLDNGRTLQLSGFTDAERQLQVFDVEWARANPGKRRDTDTVPFGLNDTITFKYRGITADGLPMEARYWRKRTDE